MASLTTDKHGFRLDFSVDGRRKCVRLSQLGEDQAERARHHVEVALRAHRRGQPIPVATVDWLYRSAPRHLLSALDAERVVDDRRLLSDAWRSWVSAKVQRVSARRIAAIERVGDELLRAVGDVELETVTASVLQGWVDGMVETGSADNTISGKSAIVRQFFAWAVAERLLVASPALELRASYARCQRMTEVDGDVVRRLAAEAGESGDWELRLALLLARWGGLRAAEILRVRLEDVNPLERSLLVRDTKRAGKGHSTRLVPLFPELEPVAERLGQALPEQMYAEGRDGLLLPVLGALTTTGMDQRAKRLCTRVGVHAWTRFWQNMRATRESELMDAFSLKDACKWIGNSPDVAMKHYALVRRTEFDRASGLVSRL